MPIAAAEEIAPRLRKGSDHQTNSTDPVRVYPREIGRVPLLNYEQEIICGKQVQQMVSLLDAKNLLAKKLHREPMLSEWLSQVDLLEAELKEALRLGQRAKQKMIEANLRLVVAIDKKYQKRNMEFLDLNQERTIGLERGVEKFDPIRGYKFSTYAYWWIRQAMTRAIAEKSRTIRLPAHITEKQNKLKKIQRQLSQRLGRTPTLAQIATELGSDQEQVRNCLALGRKTLSLNLRVGDDHDTELGDLLEGLDTHPENLIEQSQLLDELQLLLQELKPQQREVLILRFGLRDGEALNLAKIGSRLNLCRERVRQIELQALKSMQQHERGKTILRDYL